jgi:hypothetical protein
MNTIICLTFIQESWKMKKKFLLVIRLFNNYYYLLKLISNSFE